MNHYRQDLTHCAHANASAYTQQLAAYEQQLAQGKDTLAAAIIDLCSHSADLAEIDAHAHTIARRFAQIIVCGAGGSGLSGRVLTSLKLYGASPQLYVLDNIDPNAIDALLARCKPADTLVIAISKSGSTAETLSQFYALLHQFRQTLGEKAHEHFLVITMKQKSPLFDAAQAHGMTMLEHPADIGGRFSLFTSVGLLPAAIAGLDIAAFRKGAHAVAAQLGKGEHPARLGAALQYAQMQSGCNMSVMFPYCDRLAGFTAWYRQSWAESLGKGGKGTTPIRASGTTDQHSQLQLYLDGPRDKFFTMILHRRAGSGQQIHAPEIDELAYLKGKTTGDLIEAEQRATLETLIAHDRPVRVIELEKLDEETLGALLMHFMLEIFFMARLLEVNPFDQPAVEESKRRARQYLLGKTP